MQKLFFILLFLLSVNVWVPAQNVSISGAVSGNGSYPTLTDAFAALNAGAQTGATIIISILNDTYEGTGTALLNAGAWTSLTIAPVGQPRTILGATTAGQPMVDLNGVRNLSISGQLGGQKSLTFFNSTPSTTIHTSTIRLRNAAQNNSISHCKIFGASQTALNLPGGVILFAPGTSGGTSSNTINECEIGPGDANLPSKCIFNFGSTTLADMNQLNMVVNNHFIDCFSATQASSGMMLREGGLYWTIAGNRFYQTGLRTKSSGTGHNDIRIESTMGNFGHVISNNICGTRPVGAPKSQFRLEDKDAHYIPIMLGFVSLLANNSVSDNQVKDIYIETTPITGPSNMFIGIQNAGSNGGVSNNIVGSTTDSSSIVLVGMHSGVSGAVGIAGGQADAQSFTGNQIGGIRVVNNAGGDASLSGISVSYYLGSVTIENNTIGFAAAPLTIRGTGLNGGIRGISAFAGSLSVRTNTVSHLYSNQANPVSAPGLISSNLGIYAVNGSLGSGQVHGNTVHSIVLSHPTGPNHLIGIETDNVLSITNNLIHSLYFATTNSGSRLVGLDMLQGNADVSNNMIRLGFSPDAVPMTTGISIFGIHNLIARPRYDHNSVYIGGTGVSDTSDTYALYSLGGHPAMRFLNNIFVNARSNGSGTGTHYALAHGGNPQFPPLPTSNGNDLWAPGSGGRVGLINGQDQTNIFDWRVTTGMDFNSISDNPRFINPNGSAAAGDLHIGPVSPIESQGVTGPFISVDIDNQNRATLTPRDIGADAGNFTMEAVLAPELEVRGNGIVIQAGDSTPSTADGTDFGMFAGCAGATGLRSFTVRNIGNAPLTYSGASVFGASAFSVTPQTPATLAPGQSLMFTVHFASPVPGTFQATLVFTNNDQDESPFFFELLAVIQPETIPPVANCQAITVPIGINGIAIVNASALGNGSSDNCGIASYTAMPAQFDCSQIGTQSVQLTVLDAAGNSDTCSAQVNVLDNAAPAAICQPVTLQLDSSGVGATTATAVNNGSTDNCGISSMSLSATSFTCAQAGPQSVTLTVTDAAGNAGTCTATVTVVDNLSPATTCAPVTLVLDANGQASLTPAIFGANATDNCGIASQVLSQSLFDCTDVGPNSVTVTATDAAGNTGSCAQIVTVADNQVPVATCQSANLYLDNSGQASLSGSLVDGGSTDNCAIASLSVSTSQFTCAQLGSQPVVLTVADASGNTATCTTTVNVLDYNAPVAICQPTSIALNASGVATLNPAALNAGSTDNCGVDTLLASLTTFTCAHIGSTSVQLTVVDASGNDASCTTTVMVTETVPPIAICQPTTLTLNGAGQAQLPGALINGGSSDNCGIATMLPNQVLFNCSHVGVQTITLTVADASGNTATCTAQVTVVDNIAPAITCTNLSITVPSSGVATISPAMVGSATDLCGIASYQLSQTQFGCAQVGANTVLLTVTDLSGNSSTCSATVTATATPLALQLNPPALGPCGHHLACAGMSNATASASPSGACAPYTYAWSNGQAGATATGLGSGTHSVTVTAADGQQQVQSITLTAPAPLVAAVTATSSCQGSNTGSATATVSGGQSCLGHTYLWSNGLTAATLAGLAAGSYQLTVTDAAGCADTASILVGSLPASSVAITQNQGTLTASPGFVAYQWYDSTGAISGAVAGQFTPLSDGVYFVIATDSNGCSWTSAVFPFLYVGTQVPRSSLSDIILYPNPGQGVFHFDLKAALACTVQVTDLHGRVLYTERLENLDASHQFDLSALPAGVYLVSLAGEEGQRVHFRLQRE